MSTLGIQKLGQVAAGATAVVALVAGCASSSPSAKPAAGAASSSVQSTRAVSGSVGGLKSRSTAIGKVLVDAAGHTVYELVGDSAAHQTCTGRCLVVWPPIKTNGSQTIVNGHPAFTYVRDTSPGQTTGQNVTDQWGLWLALGADGNPIGASAAASSKAPASHSSTSKSSAPGGGGPAF